MNDIPEHLREGLKILLSEGYDVKAMLDPIKKADDFEREVQKQKGVWHYLTPEEKKTYYNVFSKS